MFELKNVDYQNASHVKYDIKYHIVWITKYRYKILNNDIGQRTDTDMSKQGCYDNKRSYSKRPYSYSRYSRVMPAWPGSCKNSPVSQGQEFKEYIERHNDESDNFTVEDDI